MNKLRTAYLFLVSLFFYFKTSGVFVILLLFTVLSDFLWARLIARSQKSWLRKYLLSQSVILNLLVLVYFKYSYFFAESFKAFTGAHLQYFNHFAAFSNTFFFTHFDVNQLLLPVGVSFFTFQSLSYTIDVYRGKVEPVKSIIDYGFFVSFFPHLVAGPIVKAHDFLNQIYQKYELSRQEFGLAVFWILNGFLKKIVADYLALNYVDRIFENPNLFSGFETILGVFGYSIQIYMDFSGYTDMAIGLALLFGYRLKMNFNSPYKAITVSDFWKRWHISLSSWLQEYLYFPLGGNRQGSLGSYICIGIIAFVLVLLSAQEWILFVLVALAVMVLVSAYFSKAIRKSLNTNVNLMVTMLLGGLWHGSSWLFLIWGGLNGLGLVVQKFWSRYSPFRNSENLVVRLLCVALTLCFISFTRIFFRSSDLPTVYSIFDRIGNYPGFEHSLAIVQGYQNVLLIMLLAYLVHWIPESWKEFYRHWFAKQHVMVMLLIGIVAVLTAYQFMSGDMQPFIYFQF
ncbi:MAG TPA: MBOAT family O-acyltransferase [Bacteroidia bacterium]|nr:MBOAT family O-acyltransferase [Bacteroidia bacterium]